MDAGPELKRELSVLLQEELAKQLVPGESVTVSLPGSFGEAFAVTNNRAIIIRECDTGRECRVHAYLLASVKGARASSSATGGFIELELDEPPADVDQARVYFPAQDLPVFQRAAEFVSKQAADRAATRRASAAVSSSCEEVSDTHRAPRCPQCDAVLDQFAVFCGQCGYQARMLCVQCGSASPTASKFCTSCGRMLQEFSATCRKCGARISRWMHFCTECGSITGETCASCGAHVAEGWKYCPTCGRRLGSGYVNPRTVVASRIQSRLEEEPEPTEPRSEPDVASAAPADISNIAALHNHRGRELFEQEDIEGAIREFRAAVALEPGNASYHCNLAVALDENDQDAEALTEYENTLRLDPNDLTALLSLGYMYSENEEMDRARKAWNRVIEIAPDSAEAQEARTNLDNLAGL